MIIAIISDLHDNLANLETCLRWCQKQNINKLICCGDITNIETIKYLANNFLGKIFLVPGNCRLYKEEDLKHFKNIKYRPNIFYLAISGTKIAFCHEKIKIKRIKKGMDFIFYGHSHKPMIEKDKNTIIANPGNIANIIYPATFATLNLDTKKLILHRVNKNM